MYLARSSCVICREQIDKIQYNLKTTHSKKTNQPLIKLVEDLYRNVAFLHCNICTECHDLLNELDFVKYREKELCSQLKTYISKVETSKTSDIISSQSENLYETECTEIPDIDLKGLPIKVKRIKLKNEETKLMKKSIVLATKEDQNEKMFEQIQTSIQMDLSKHVEELMSKNKPTQNILCEICGQSFKTKNGYENHIKKHDNLEDDIKLLGLNKEGPCFCHICGKCFSQKASLSRHLPIHTGESRYQCESCGKKFVHHSSFNMHRKIHAGVRNFECTVCKHRFLSNSHLKRHVRATHDKEKNYHCEYCGKKFAENYNLLAHMKIVHEDDTVVQQYTEEVVNDVNCEQTQTIYQIEDHSTVVFTLEKYE